MAQLQVVNVTTDATVASGATTATALTGYSFDCGGGSLLVVLVEANSGSGTATDITGITYGGTALTKAGRVQWATSNACLADAWYLLDPAAGSNTIAITVTSAALIGWMSGAMSFAGHARNTPIRNTTFTATGNDANPIVQVSGSTRGGLLVDICGTGAGFTGNGNLKSWTLNVNGNSAGNNAASQTAGSGGSVTHSYAVTADMWGLLVVEVLAASDEADSATADVLLDAYGPIRFTQRTAFQGDAFQENAFQVLGGTTGAGGASTYNEGDTASALAQDVLLAAQGMPTGQSDSALAQDQLLAAAGLTGSQADSALAQDILATAQGFASSLTQSALAQETLTTAQGFNSAESDGALAQDQLTGAQAMLAALSERALAQDFVLPAMQMPAELAEGGPADVLFDSTLLRPGAGSQYDESLIESCSAMEALAAALGSGGGVEAKIGGAAAAAGISIFVFDD